MTRMNWERRRRVPRLPLSGSMEKKIARRSKRKSSPLWDRTDWKTTNLDIKPK